MYTMSQHVDPEAETGVVADQLAEIGTGAPRRPFDCVGGALKLAATPGSVPLCKPRTLAGPGRAVHSGGPAQRETYRARTMASHEGNSIGAQIHVALFPKD